MVGEAARLVQSDFETSSPFSEMCSGVEEVRTFVDSPEFEAMAHKLKLLFAMVEKDEGLKSAA